MSSYSTTEWSHSGPGLYELHGMKSGELVHIATIMSNPDEKRWEAHLHDSKTTVITVEGLTSESRDDVIYALSKNISTDLQLP